MSTLSIRLPKSLHEEIKALARHEGISMNQFIALAVAEKAAVLRTTRLLERRLEPGDLERFQALLDKAPDVEPEDYDRL